MISAEALVALGGLDQGARYNTMCVAARELIKAGLACDDWGRLGITEAGRVYLRRGTFHIAIDDHHVADMAQRRPDAIDPMTAPHLARAKTFELLPQAPAAPVRPAVPAATRREQLLRAACAASVETKVWLDDKWIEKFVHELEIIENEAKPEEKQ